MGAAGGEEPSEVLPRCEPDELQGQPARQDLPSCEMEAGIEMEACSPGGNGGLVL